MHKNLPQAPGRVHYLQCTQYVQTHEDTHTRRHTHTPTHSGAKAVSQRMCGLVASWWGQVAARWTHTRTQTPPHTHTTLQRRKANRHEKKEDRRFLKQLSGETHSLACEWRSFDVLAMRPMVNNCYQGSNVNLVSVKDKHIWTEKDLNTYESARWPEYQ